MRHVVAFSILVAFLSVSSVAQVPSENLTVPGIVTDADSRQPIHGAKVTVIGGLAKSEEATDVEGRFSLTLVQAVKPGSSVRIRVEKMGYEPYDKSETVALSPTPLLIRLRANPTHAASRISRQKNVSVFPPITMRISPSTFPVSVPAHSTLSILPLSPYQTLSGAADYLVKYVNDCGEEHFWPTQAEISSKGANDYEQVLKIEIGNHSQQTLVSGKLIFRVLYNKGSTVGCMPPNNSSDQEDVILVPTLDPGRSFEIVAVNQTNSCAWLLPPTSASVKMSDDNMERQVPLTLNKDPLYFAGVPAFSPTKIKWEGIPTKRGGYGIIRSSARCNGDFGPPPLRASIDNQAVMLRSWIRQIMQRTNVDEMWSSQIFQSVLDNIPGGPDVDVPSTLKYLDSKGEVAILETASRPYRTWWGETFQQDIRFSVKSLSLTPRLETIPRSMEPDVHQLLDSSKLAMGWTLHKRADRWTMTFIINTNLLNEPLRTAITQMPDSTIDAGLVPKINALWAEIRTKVPAPKPVETPYGLVKGQEFVEHVAHWISQDPGNTRQPETVEWTYEVMLNGSGITPHPQISRQVPIAELSVASRETIADLDKQAERGVNRRYIDVVVKVSQ